MNSVSTTQKSADNDVSQLGLWLYLMTDCLLFAALFATYAVLLVGVADGPGPAEIFEPWFVLTQTGILLASTLSAGIALVAASFMRRQLTIIMLVLTGALGLLFVGMELYEFQKLISEGFTWQTSAFLSAFFTLVGTHGLHIMVGLIWLGVLLYRITKHGLTSKSIGHIKLFTMFWHFLDVVWIFIFTFVYMMGIIQ